MVVREMPRGFGFLQKILCQAEWQAYNARPMMISEVVPSVHVSKHSTTSAPEIIPQFLHGFKFLVAENRLLCRSGSIFALSCQFSRNVFREWARYLQEIDSMGI